MFLFSKDFTEKDSQKNIPEGLSISCRNSETMVTVCGPEEKITSFVATMKAKQVNIESIQCSALPLHSQFMEDVVTLFRQKMENVSI